MTGWRWFFGGDDDCGSDGGGDNVEKKDLKMCRKEK